MTANLSIPDSVPARQAFAGSAPLTVLIGPEGGLSTAEDAQARAAGFAPVGRALEGLAP